MSKDQEGGGGEGDKRASRMNSLRSYMLHTMGGAAPSGLRFVRMMEAFIYGRKEDYEPALQSAVTVGFGKLGSLFPRNEPLARGDVTIALRALRSMKVELGLEPDVQELAKLLILLLNTIEERHYLKEFGVSDLILIFTVFDSFNIKIREKKMPLLLATHRKLQRFIEGGNHAMIKQEHAAAVYRVCKRHQLEFAFLRPLLSDELAAKAFPAATITPE